MLEQRLSKDSSIYQHRLLKRIRYIPNLYLSYWSILLAIVLFDAVLFNPYLMVASFVFIFGLHILIVHLYFIFKERRPIKNWAYSFRFPWLGMVPKTHFPLDRFFQLHQILFWITLAAIAVSFPWISHVYLLHLLFCHLWLIIPRLVFLIRMRRHRAYGYIKLNEQDVSCYEL